jgi:lipopolysaccharide/colanic/teichoic acid biosynthesis glycosyltransferase
MAKIYRAGGAMMNCSITGKTLKRTFDICLSGVGIILLFPFALMLGIIILSVEGRPVFYCQKRVGKDKKVFTAIKFRSMRKNAEDKRGPVLAKENDPRITPMGKKMRATAMDELPQLLNIFKGDMSFVGPRPERPELAENFSRIFSDYDKRYNVRPGLTGIAQIYGNYDSPANKKLKYDLLYIKKMNLCLDLYMIFISLWITIRGRWDLRENRKIKKT